MRNDNALADRIRNELASRAEAQRTREELTNLNASALVNLPAVTFVRGYGAEETLTAGQSYDLRFFDDHVLVTPLGKTGTLIETSYGEGGELHFLCTTITPEALRVELSRPLGVIRSAQAGHAPPGARQQGEPAAAIAELTRLASMLDNGLLTRDEFDHLKAQLLAGS